MKVSFFELAPDVEDDGGVVGIAKGGGVVFVLLGENLNVAFFGEGEFGGRIGEVFPIRNHLCGIRADALDLLKSGVWLLEGVDAGTEVLDETFDFDGTGFWELVKSDEGFGFSHGRG